MAATLNIELKNQSTSSNVHAYITGQELDNNNALFLLQSDGKTFYNPTSPSSTLQPLAQDCAIPLGAPGNSVTVRIPHIAGGRIWFSIDNTLTFLLNPGPGLVEPSVTNPSDPNVNILWGFCEFTFNSAQLFANISYVDFVSVPISLNLTNASNASQVVTGMSAAGLDAVCSGLNAQQSSDNAGWSSLIVPSPAGGNLRALSPNNGITLNPSLFKDYYQPYIDQFCTQYASKPFTIDTQAQWGSVPGKVNNDALLDFGSGLTFAKPSAADIFSCSTGPFAASNNIQMGALIACLCAAFNRSTLHIEDTTPKVSPSEHYQTSPTNHYSRIVHAANADGKGYAFPFDDVTPAGGEDQSGAVNDPNPQLLTVAVGGGGVASG